MSEKITIKRGYKVELKPNKAQRALLGQAVGCARFAYNWGLFERIKRYEESKKSITAIDQHKDLCAIKKSEFPWMYNVTKCAPQEALRNLEDAFNRFFSNIKTGKKPGFPKFKKKFLNDRFSISNDQSVYITKSSVKLPKIFGVIKLKERNYIPTDNIKYCKYTISRDVDRWYLSVNCEIKIDKVTSTDNVIGIDVGIKKLATISDGRFYDKPNIAKDLDRRLKRIQREKSRRVKGSSNRKKSIIKLQKIHRKIRRVRLDNIHKMTSDLVKAKPGLIVMEDLSIKNMLKNHNLARSISDASWSEIKRQLIYKSHWNGSSVFEVDRWYPSSKTCSGCGNIKSDLKLSDRIYKCDCGLILDRDLNAAINLERYPESRGILYKNKACGKERSS